MKLRNIFLILMVAVLILGCSAKTAKNGDSVSVIYSVYDEQNVLIDDNNNQPLTFTLGNGEVIKGFNYAVIGMKVGESKQVIVEPEEGYGMYIPTKKITESLDALRDAGIEPEVNGILYSTINNQRQRGVITDINDTHVVIDFNHPLAGTTLTFNIKLVSINTHAEDAI